jgi:hypothetical protein
LVVVPPACSHFVASALVTAVESALVTGVESALLSAVGPPWRHSHERRTSTSAVPATTRPIRRFRRFRRFQIRRESGKGSHVTAPGLLSSARARLGATPAMRGFLRRLAVARA